tara:strand:+ start:86 stop:319 length:234 start_codon:yes stop_codon:yes gene_type:complete
MPQIGWFEILVVVILAVLIIGPKDFPIVLRKIGNWTSSVKKYFANIQRDFSDIENVVEKEISLENKNLTEDQKKDER